MFLELKDKNSNFRSRYFEMLKCRLAYGNLELEGIGDNLTDPMQSMKIYNQLDAINYIFNQDDSEELQPVEFMNMLCNVAKKATGGEINNFRTTKVMVMGSNVERSKPSMIRMDLYSLIQDYNYCIKNCKSIDELYEIEAQFHIRLLRIHPFEDGNKRTSRIVLVHNLCRHNLAPCVFSKEMQREYCDYIENYDVKGLASLIKRLSEKELQTMLALYRNLDENGLIAENRMSPDQEKAYQRITQP